MVIRVKDALRLLRNKFFEALYIGVTPLLSQFSSRIIFTYASEAKQDGTGAQIQRNLAIYALSKRLGASFVYTPIGSVAIHPLDPFQTLPEMNLFLQEVNFAFELPSCGSKHDIRSLFLPSLTLRAYLKIVIQTLFRNQDVLIRMIEPYAFLDRMPHLYKLATNDLLNWKLIKTNSVNEQIGETPKLAIHYRQGVGGLVVQFGEKYPREIPISYFLDFLNNHLNVSDFGSIDIFTDAPKSNMFFSPPQNQEKLWETNPKFDGKSMEVTATDLSSFAKLTSDRAQFHIGGSPLEAIISMSNADVLVMGRSSLSYVAGLLNENGKIFYPPDFWHSPLDSWVRY